VLLESNREHEQHRAEDNGSEASARAEAELCRQSPAPWHIGIAPNGHSTTFARPEVSASRRSLAMAPANGNSSRDRLPVTIRALEG